MSLFYEEATCKSSTIKGLLYTPENPEECKKGTLSNWSRLSRISSTALLSHWGWQSLKDMMSLRTDFETHAIWQGYLEDPAGKDFVARKACTIALSKARGTRQSTLFISLEIPWGFHTRAVLRSLVGLMSRKKVSVWWFLWVRKVWFTFAQWTFAWETFGKRQKASCFEKPTCSVPEIWGRMYNVLPCSAKGTRNGTRNWIPVQPRKGTKKEVSSIFAKILEYESSNYNERNMWENIAYSL
jgi:hypothetical protein